MASNGLVKLSPLLPALCSQQAPMKDEDLIKQIIPLWYSSMAWANELLIRAFKLEQAKDILKPEFRGLHQIQGTNWFIRTHGIGVDVFKTVDVGGIDFDFGKPVPDEWRLKIFFEKQYNDGQLPYAEYQCLSDDEDRLKLAIKNVLSN